MSMFNYFDDDNDINRYEVGYESYEISTDYRTQLDRIPIEEIEKYLREKKLDRINKKK